MNGKSTFYTKYGKRIFDLALVLPILIVLSPLLACIALLVRIVLGRPILFHQERPGLNGKPFTVYKFRTMTDERDEEGNLLPDEKRLSLFGKLLRATSLDELPALFNVLKGDISLVGPRPLLMEYLPLYNAFQFRRHEVHPGITGYAQVMGRNTLNWEEKFTLDVSYVDNLNFYLDIKILAMTILKVLKREGINQSGQATAEKFKGSSN